MNGQMGFGDGDGTVTRQCPITGVHEGHTVQGFMEPDYWCPGVVLTREARTLARGTDVETSKGAAASNTRGKNNNRTLCLRAHAESPKTFDEVAAITGLTEHETGRRCADLRNAKLIEWLFEDGKPVTRPTTYGRAARVCVITEKGRASL